MSIQRWMMGWPEDMDPIYVHPDGEYVLYADHVAAVAEAEVFARAGSRLRERDRIRQAVVEEFDRHDEVCGCEGLDRKSILSIIDGAQPAEACAGNSPSGLGAVHPVGQSADPERYKVRGDQ